MTINGMTVIQRYWWWSSYVLFLMLGASKSGCRFTGTFARHIEELQLKRDLFMMLHDDFMISIRMKTYSGSDHKLSKDGAPIEDIIYHLKRLRVVLKIDLASYRIVCKYAIPAQAVTRTRRHPLVF
jgi:hypothetical protein